MKEMTYATANELYLLRLSVMAPRCPLRHRPCMIVGPNDGYIVTTLGFADVNGFTPVR